MTNDFETDGFALIENAFSSAEISKISDEVDRILEGRANEFPAEDLVFEPGAEPRSIRNVFRLHQHNPFFMELARHSSLVEPVQAILGSPLRLYGSQLFAKPAQVGSAVPRHQDMPYWPFDPPNLVSAWIALDDSTLENGCVHFVAGSHKLGLLLHVPSGVTGNSLVLAPDPRLDQLTEHPVEVRRGSCSLHHALAVHRSEPNRSPNRRRALIFIYMGADVRLTDPSRLRGEAVFPTLSS